MNDLTDDDYDVWQDWTDERLLDELRRRQATVNGLPLWGEDEPGGIGELVRERTSPRAARVITAAVKYVTPRDD